MLHFVGLAFQLLDEDRAGYAKSMERTPCF